LALFQETSMAKGEQRSNKMVKKPKKDSSPPKDAPTTSTRPVAPVTAVAPKGKMKNK
jgi:hypothetical protein